MKKYCVCLFLLSALSVVESQPLNIHGHLGKEVEFTCKGWNIWSGFFSVKDYVKYLCHSPCTHKKHIILKVENEEKRSKDRIEVTNKGDSLLVEFKNLQKSDSKKYFCALERYGLDSFIEVKVTVTGDESSSVATPLPTVSPRSSDEDGMKNESSSVATPLPTVSPRSSDEDGMKNESSSIATPLPTVSPRSSDEDGMKKQVFSFLLSAFGLLAVLMVLLFIVCRVKKKKQSEVEEKDTQQDAQYDEIRLEDQPGMSQPADISTLDLSADLAALHADYFNRQLSKCDSDYSNVPCSNSRSSFGVKSGRARVRSRATNCQSEAAYCVAQPTERSAPNQSESNENEPFYSLLQCPQATCGGLVG